MSTTLEDRARRRKLREDALKRGETKTCTKCQKTYPASKVHFYQHPSGKYGLTPRCKPCVNEENKQRHAAYRQGHPEEAKRRANARTRKSYHKDIEYSRAKQREYQAKYRADPIKGANIKARKRGGGAKLSPRQIEAIFVAQGGKCAICEATDPGHRTGWNLDHCHKTSKVRFILCSACNRGLAAFRDNAAVMRKGAKMLDQFYAAFDVGDEEETPEPEGQGDGW